RPLLLEQLEERCLLTYSTTDLGTLGVSYNTSIANGINAAGDIVGSSTNNAVNLPITHAFLYHNSAMTDLGTLDGGTNSAATGLDSSTPTPKVVGSSERTVSGVKLTHAFLYNGTSMQDLGTLIGMGQDSKDSFATAINTFDKVVGYSNFSGGQLPSDYHAFLYDNNTMNDLGTYGQSGRSSAYAIDNASTPHEVGKSQGFGDFCETGETRNEHAVQWQGTGSAADLGTLPNGWVSHAYGINASATVAGDSTAAADLTNCGKYPPHAFTRTSAGVFTQLDASPPFTIGQSRAYSIYNATPAQVVGIYNTGT